MKLREIATFIMTMVTNAYLALSEGVTLETASTSFTRLCDKVSKSNGNLKHMALQTDLQR